MSKIHARANVHARALSREGNVNNDNKASKNSKRKSVACERNRLGSGSKVIAVKVKPARRDSELETFDKHWM